MNSTSRKIYSGNKRMYDIMVERMINDKKTFRTIQSGSVYHIHAGKSFYAFRDSEGKKEVIIPKACRELNLEIQNYFKLHEIDDILSPLRYHVTKSNKFIELIDNGIDHFISIDIKACYWTILYSRKIISEKLYWRYLENKKARLIALGNLYKKSQVVNYNKGRKLITTYLKNPFERVWKLVVNETYKIYHDLERITSNNILKFQTDCFYCLPEYSEEVTGYLDDLGFNFIMENLKYINKQNNFYIFLSDINGVKSIPLINFDNDRTFEESSETLQSIDYNSENFENSSD